MGNNFVHFEMFHLKKGRRGTIALKKYDNMKITYETQINDFVLGIYQQLLDHYNEMCM